jgi:hypothetical protein
MPPTRAESSLGKPMVVLPIVPCSRARTFTQRFHVEKNTLSKIEVEHKPSEPTSKFGNIFNGAESCNAQSKYRADCDVGFRGTAEV